MSTALVILLSLAVAGLLAWRARRLELAREPAPTATSRVLDEVFGAGAAQTDDAVLLERLLKHRSECIDDITYVDQVRRLMLNTQQVDQARGFLKDVERRRVVNPDELKAQSAWVDLADAHVAWTNGDEARTAALYAQGVAAANELRVKWPEWSLPYRILEEAGRASSTNTGPESSTDYAQVEHRARERMWNGAWVRSLTDWQPIAAVFVAATIGMLGLCAGVSGLLATREMLGLTYSSIAATQPGYVELKGTLHLPPNAAAVIGPYSKTAGVWYELESRDGFKNSRTTVEHSAQPFLLRDESGEVVIEPKGITVRTRHLAASFGSDGGISSSRRTSERMLKENDVAYVLGELSVHSDVDGKTQRRVKIAENGRRLLVSNLSEEQLILLERVWLWIGAAVFLTAVVVLAWSYHQRYFVNIFPGLLR